MAGELAQRFPESWKLCRLDEVATVIDSLHKTPTYSEVGRPMVRVTDVQGGFLDVSKTLRVTEDVFQEFTRRYAPKRGDIVFSRVGSYGNASYANTDTPFCLGQNTALLSPRINGRFLHLFLQSNDSRRQIEQVVVGSTQKTISLKSISALQVPIPPANELEAIAHILGTLDDKIELNQRMNETLEAMARALFKSCFVDFDPIRAKAEGRDPGLPKELADLFPSSFEDSELGKIPKGWELQRVREIGSIICGKTPPTQVSDYYGNDVPFITIPDMHGRIFATAVQKQLSRAGAESQQKKMLPAGAICVSCIATAGLVVITSDLAQTNQQINSVVPFQKDATYFWFWSLRNLGEEIKVGGSGGSVLTNLSTGRFSELRLLACTERLRSTYNSLVTPFFCRILTNERESLTLTALRDTLLPKLISGELRVKDAERFLNDRGL